MPAITVRLYDGRSPEQLEEFAAAVIRLSTDLLDARPGKTAVRFESLGPRPDAATGPVDTDGSAGASST